MDIKVALFCTLKYQYWKIILKIDGKKMKKVKKNWKIEYPWINYWSAWNMIRKKIKNSASICIHIVIYCYFTYILIIIGFCKSLRHFRRQCEGSSEENDINPRALSLAVFEQMREHLTSCTAFFYIRTNFIHLVYKIPGSYTVCFLFSLHSYLVHYLNYNHLVLDYCWVSSFGRYRHWTSMVWIFLMVFQQSILQLSHDSPMIDTP